jgi:multidrug resistance efflux pump
MRFTLIIGLVIATIVTRPGFAQEPLEPLSLAGTVIADNKAGLSFGARGCIIEISKNALQSRNAFAEQVLVRLDDRAAILALKTAQARLSDLEAALNERDLAVSVVKAEITRVEEEQRFVDKEFERTHVLFQRGLVNETTLEAAERRKMEALFAVDRSKEELKRVISNKARANIAVEIGDLEVLARELDLDELTLKSPFSGVLLNFEPKLGDCVSQGSLAAQIYSPDEKSVETFVFMDQLVAGQSFGIVIGNPVDVIRINEDTCRGKISLIDTQANLETQNVKITIKLNPQCASVMFLNEAVTIKTLLENG